MFISSVPLQILTEECGLLFGILNRYMRNDGWILIDAPAVYDISTLRMWHGAEASGWTKLKHVLLKGFYHKGENQLIHIYYKSVSELERIAGSNTSIQVERQRPKSHPCEFCPDVIASFIKKYSEIGDVVLDGFCGTGTVPGEADRLGRKGIGCDVRCVENIKKAYSCK